MSRSVKSGAAVVCRSCQTLCKFNKQDATMNIPIDTINSAMALAGGVLALLAAIVAAVTTMLPKERAAAAMAQLRAKTFNFIAVASAIASTVSGVVFDSPRFALIFVVICASLVSINYLRVQGPATRAETFVLIIQIAIVLGLAFLYMGTRILTVLERLA